MMFQQKKYQKQIKTGKNIIEILSDSEESIDELIETPLKKLTKEKPKWAVKKPIEELKSYPVSSDKSDDDESDSETKEPLKKSESTATKLEHNNDEFDTIVVDDDGIIPQMKVKLLKHQINGVNWMVAREQTPYPSLFGGGILADDMGLGKTIQTIATVLSNPSPHRWKTTLIVCTLSTVSQWESEIRDKVKSGNLKVCLYYGSSRETDPYQLACADIVLTTYGILQSEFSRAEPGDFQLLNPKKIPKTEEERIDLAYKSKASKKKKGSGSCLFRLKWWRIVLDEAQYIKNRNTGKHKAAIRAEAYNRWCLTGTPIQNELKDIWSLLHFIRAPQCENLRYFNDLQSRLKCANSKPAFDELHKLIEPLLLRREKEKLKEDIASNFSDLPPCEKEKIYLDFTPDEALLYKQLWDRAQADFNKMLAKGTVLKNYMHIFETILRLRQACDHSYLLMKNSSDLVHLKSGDDASEEYLMIINMQLASYFEFLRVGDKMKPTELLNDENSVALSQSIVLSEKPKENCPLCSDDIQNPILTSCNHYFCNDCFESYKEGNPSFSSVVNCPTCYTPLSSHQIRSVTIKKAKRRRSTFTTKQMEVALVNQENNLPFSPNSNTSRPTTFMDLPNDIIVKIFGYLKETDMASIFNLNLSCKRFYAVSRIIFGCLKRSTKVRAIVDSVKTLQKKGKCVIFSQFTKFLEVIQYALLEENIELVRLDGSMRLSERKKVIDKFQNDDKVRVFVVSLKAANCGLNLTAGRFVFMVDPWWNGAVEQQAIDRVHRYGQKNPVTVYRFIMRGSIEENLLLIQEKKLKISSLVLDEPCNNKLSQEDLVTLFTEIRAMQDTNNP